MPYKMVRRISNPLSNSYGTAGFVAAVLLLSDTTRRVGEEHGIDGSEVCIGWPYELGHVVKDGEEGGFWNLERGVTSFKGIFIPYNPEKKWQEIGLYVPV